MLTTLLTCAAIGVSGSYFEARSCSIFAGPCHYSGEVMTDGRTAVIGLKFEIGSYKGVSLSGLEAAAVVQSPENLSFGMERVTHAYVDTDATPQQKSALLELLRSRSDLGKVVSVTAAEIDLRIGQTEGHAAIRTRAGVVYSATTSSRECLACNMPGVLWYSPLTQGANVSVATVESQTLTQGALGETFRRDDESAAFVGTFAW